MSRSVLACAAACLAISGARTPLLAQQDEPDLTVNGLLRTGLRVESDDTGGNTGFELYDARLGLSGKVGLVFDYFVQAEVDFDRDRVRLLDATLSIPLRDDLLRFEVGLTKAPSNSESMKPKKDLTFVERSQATLALSPGRQVGLRLSGRALEGKLRYWGGMFNGNGGEFENDNDSFLFAFRGEYNSVGEVEFFEDLVVEGAAHVAISRDSALDVLPVAESTGPLEGTAPGQRIALVPFSGDRLVWGLDLRSAYRAFFMSASYMRADYDLDGGQSLDAEGWTVQGGYTVWGAVDWVARYDAFRPAVGLGFEPEWNKFLVLGLNLYPGFHAKVGFQYAIGVDGTLLGPTRAIDGTNTGPGLADKQFQMSFQVAY